MNEIGDIDDRYLLASTAAAKVSRGVVIANLLVKASENESARRRQVVAQQRASGIYPGITHPAAVR